MSSARITALRRLELFQSLPESGLARLTRNAITLNLPRAADLFEQGEEPEFLHVLLDGGVQLLGGATDGRETVVEVVRPVDCFILAAVLSSEPYLMTARTLEPTRVLLIPATELRQQLAEDPQLALTLLATLSKQYRDMVRNIKNLKLRTAVQRLGCYLVSEFGNAAAGTEVRLHVDKKLLASHLGMTPETLSRAFNALRSHGATVHGGRVTLTDPAALRALCQPDSLIDILHPAGEAQ
ncbi:MAG: helix-turn-helix domain-containing protein [Gammaproteobacteria bacterium]|nr:helix-turn-helix domain-containing protein [Gammaproteobacteria bacterium]